MGFIYSYKRLEKLCSEIFGPDRPVSAYIDEMKSAPGFLYIDGWGEDLKMLKHYRWMRNQIAHDPDCSEENMCSPKDAAWIDAFYNRIMHQTDPLALYHKAKHSRPAAKFVTMPITETKHKNTPDTSNLAFAIVISLMLIIVFVLLVLIIQGLSY